MDYDIERDEGYGFDLGDIYTYGYGQGPVWSTTLRDYSSLFEDFEALIQKDYDLLEAKLGGDSTIEGLVHLVARGAGRNPSPEALAQLQKFAEEYSLEDEHAWMEWENRF